jgi:hypothetical protein
MRNYGLIEAAIAEQTGAKVRGIPTPAKDAVTLHCTWLRGYEKASGEILVQEETKDIIILHETLDSYTLDAILQVVLGYLP